MALLFRSVTSMRDTRSPHSDTIKSMNCGVALFAVKLPQSAVFEADSEQLPN